MDTDLRYVFVSRRFLEDYRVEDRDVIGKTHYEVFPEIPERWREIHRRVLDGAVERCEEDPFPRQDGSVDWVRWECRPWRLGDGTIGGMVLYSELITERREAAEALRQSRTQYETFVNATDDIAFLKDDQLRYVMVNAANARFFGLEPGEIIGRTDAELMPPEAAAECAASDARAIKMGGLVITTERVGDRVYESRKFPVELTDGRLGVGGYVRDVTEQRRAEGEIRRLATELERRVEQRTAQLAATNRELESFAYSISHDLRAPLRALDGFSEILLQDYGAAIDETGRGYLRRIKGAANHMAGLMDGLLQLSRLNREELVLEDVDLTELARSVVTDLREQDPDRTVDVLVEAGLHAEADPKMLRVVLVNLLGNAWKFTSQHETARIEVGAAQHDGRRATEAELRRPRLLRQGRRRRVRPALRAEPLRRLPAAAHAGPVRGHGHRARHRAAHRAPPRRHRLGRGRGREGRHLLVHAGGRGRRLSRSPTPAEPRGRAPGEAARLATPIADAQPIGVASSSATRSSRDWRARMRSTSAPSRSPPSPRPSPATTA